MDNELTWEQLANWIDGRLTDAESATLAAKLASASDATQADAQWLRAFHKLSASVPLKPLSDTARQRLRTQFEQLKSAQSTEPQPMGVLSRTFRLFVATLTADSWQTSFSGVRHGEPQRDSRQLIYKTDQAEVALNIRTRDGMLDLRCQVFSSVSLDLQTVSAQLIQDMRFWQTPVSDLGDFAWSNVVPGDYDLTLTGEDFEIAIPKVSLSL